VVGAHAVGQADRREDLDIAGPAGQPAFQPRRDRGVQADVEAAVEAQFADLGRVDLAFGDQAGRGGTEAQANDFGFSGPGAEIALQQRGERDVAAAVKGVTGRADASGAMALIANSPSDANRRADKINAGQPGTLRVRLLPWAHLMPRIPPQDSKLSPSSNSYETISS